MTPSGEKCGIPIACMDIKNDHDTDRSMKSLNLFLEYLCDETTSGVTTLLSISLLVDYFVTRLSLLSSKCVR